MVSVTIFPYPTMKAITPLLILSALNTVTLREPHPVFLREKVARCAGVKRDMKHDDGPQSSLLRKRVKYMEIITAILKWSIKMPILQLLSLALFMAIFHKSHTFIYRGMDAQNAATAQCLNRSLLRKPVLSSAIALTIRW